MKKTILLLACGMFFQCGWAQELPKWVNKARKAVFSVITYNKENKILNTGNGFYIDENGTAVSDYSLFKGAERAVVVTADGKELPVTFILGANDMYDVVKFRTATDKKPTALQPAAQAAAENATVYLLPYSTQKSADVQNGTIAKIDSISNNSFYYTLNMHTTDKTVSCPIMNINGEVVGLLQKNTEKDSKESYAIGIGYAMSLSISALSGSDFTLNSIGIKKALPDDESQALVYLYMQSSQLSQSDYLELLNDFIAQYPNNIEGYQRRATCYMNFGDDEHNALAEKELEKMLDIAENKAEAHYNIAKLLYSYNLSLNGKQPYSDWTLERALNEINESLAASPEGLYYQVQGDIYFAMQKYAEASASYEAVNRTPLASAASFYSAAKAKELTPGVEMKEVIALMDSAVVRFNKPYGQDAAPYLYERARMKSAAGEYRDAVLDYNDFYDAMLGQVTAEFYMVRQQTEMQCRMYQQALDDITKAVEMEPNNSEYWLEKGSVHLRTNQVAEAIKSLQQAIALDANNAAAYRMLGYSQIQQKQKKEGLANLKKAQELGDTVAGNLIERYNK